MSLNLRTWVSSFDEVRQALEQIANELKLISTDVDLTALEARMDTAEGDIDDLESAVSALDGRITALENVVTDTGDHEDRIDALEAFVESYDGTLLDLPVDAITPKDPVSVVGRAARWVRWKFDINPVTGGWPSDGGGGYTDMVLLDTTGTDHHFHVLATMIRVDANALTYDGDPPAQTLQLEIYKGGTQLNDITLNHAASPSDFTVDRWQMQVNTGAAEMTNATDESIKVIPTQYGDWTLWAGDIEILLLIAEGVRS